MILVEELETAKTMGWHAKMSGSNPAAGAVVGTGCCSLLHPHTHINLRSHTKIKPGLSRARPRNVLHSVGAPILICRREVPPTRSLCTRFCTYIGSWAVGRDVIFLSLDNTVNCQLIFRQQLAISTYILTWQQSKF